MRVKRILCFAGVVLYLLNPISSSFQPYVWAQANSWSPPERIPFYDVDAEPPYLVADRSGTVHAFNPQEIDGTSVILYSQWTLDHSWSNAVDILLLSYGHHIDLGVYLDQTDTIHLVFLGLTAQGPSIFYSRAPARQAGSAKAWSLPMPVSRDTSSSRFVALTGDEKGNLFVLYEDAREGHGIYAVHSPDAGNTWSQPVTVYVTLDDTMMPWSIRLDMDDLSRLHAVWSVMREGGLGVEVWYARSDPNYLRWTTPVMLADKDEEDYGAEAPAIIAYQGELFVVYTDSMPPTRWFRRSYDGEQSWTEPVRPFEHVGGYGNPVLLVDSADTLHMILGNRIQDPSRPAIHGMWQSVWHGNRWSSLEAIVSGPPSSVPGAEFDPTSPQAVVSRGNVLLVTWRQDRFAGRNGIWYSYTILDAPQLPPEILPVTATASAPMATAVPVGLGPTPSPNAAQLRQSNDLGVTQASLGPANAVFLGSLPVVFLLLGYITIYILRRRDII